MSDLDPVPANPWERWGWAMGAIWLVFLAFPVIDIVGGDQSAGAKAGGLTALAAFVAVYLHGMVRLPETPGRGDGERRAAIYQVLLAALTVGICLVAGGSGLSTLPFIVALAVFTLRLRWVAVVAVLALAMPIVLPALGWVEQGSQFYVLIVALVLAVTSVVRVLEDRGVAHRQIEREYELVAERERVARDVHDVLGHSLTVLVAKAELAERVLDADPERTREELQQIQSLTREAIAEIRATVAGLRVARLGDELESARTALEAAGIEGEIPDRTDAVDPRHRLVLAWVLREAITNVVRHSGARRCVVTLESHRLRVVDDGRGAGEASDGNGLRGIRERIAAAGGTLEVGPGPDGHGTRLEAEL